MTEPKKLRIFLCHSSADKQKVHDLYQYLRQQGMAPWLDSENLTPGQEWKLEISKALRDSDVIIVCLSNSSVNKAGFVQKEIVFALDKAQEAPEGSIVIIPAKLEDCRVPERLSRYQWVDLQQANGNQRLMAALKQRAEQLELLPAETLTPAIDNDVSIPLSISLARKVVARFNQSTDGWSALHAWDIINWVWVWLYTFWLLTPSLHWPFANQAQALSAILMYVGGTLSIPLLIGLFSKTNGSMFWQQRASASHKMIRLYTHQGAGVGFHVGYFVVFLINLIIYHIGYALGLQSNPVLQRLLEVIEITFLLMVGYGSALLVPDNLWRAYQRLTLADGGIFFVFFGLGPFWGFFFYFYYPLFLDPIVGLILFLSSFTLLAGTLVWQQKRRNTAK